MKRPTRIALFGIASGLLWSLVAIFCSARTPESFMLFPIAGIIAGVLMSFALYRPVRRFSRWAILLFGILMLPVGALCFGACTSLLLTAGRFISGGGISFGDAFLGPLYSGMFYAYGAIIVSVFSIYGLILLPCAVVTTYVFHLVVLYDGNQRQSV